MGLYGAIIDQRYSTDIGKTQTLVGSWFIFFPEYQK